MGLTSGQARMLMLTSRKNDIELSMTLLSQKQMQLAWHSEDVAKEYQEKTTNMKLIMKVNDKTSANGYVKEDLTYANMTSMGYLVTDSQNRIYLTKTDGQWNIPKATNLEVETIFDNDKDGNEAKVQVVDGEEVIYLNNKKYQVVDATDILTDKTKLQNNIMNGVMFVMNTTAPGKTDGIEINNLEANTSVEWVQDTSDDAEAESKYQYETTRISHQDNLYDLEIKQLETQLTAITKEEESVQKLIDDNIKNTFDLFNSG